VIIPVIEAVSFCGFYQSLPRSFNQRATHNYKRCLALGGAKNHLMVLPDAIPGMTAQNVAAIYVWAVPANVVWRQVQW